VEPEAHVKQDSAHLRSTSAAAIGVSLAVVSMWLISGCQQPPLRASDSRSQFDRYDLSRNEHEPAYRYDEYGKRRPNLRGRLLDDR